MEWDYSKPNVIYGINPKDYQIPKNSDGTMEDLLHPLARYIRIEATYSHTVRDHKETRPILVIKGKRPRVFGLGIKEFEVIVAVPLTEEVYEEELEKSGFKKFKVKDGKVCKEMEIPREEQERRLNLLEKFLLKNKL